MERNKRDKVVESSVLASNRAQSTEYRDEREGVRGSSSLATLNVSSSSSTRVHLVATPTGTRIDSDALLWKL